MLTQDIIGFNIKDLGYVWGIVEPLLLGYSLAMLTNCIIEASKHLIVMLSLRTLMRELLENFAG